MGLFFKKKQYQELILHVDGMRCGMCEAHINDLVRRAQKVKSVKSNHHTGEVKIQYVDEIDVEKIKAAIHEAGYEVK